MNTYICPIYDLENDECFLEIVKARNLESAYEKLSETYELDNICSNDEEFSDLMSNNNYIVGLLVDIEEI